MIILKSDYNKNTYSFGSNRKYLDCSDYIQHSYKHHFLLTSRDIIYYDKIIILLKSLYSKTSSYNNLATENTLFENNNVLLHKIHFKLIRYLRNKEMRIIFNTFLDIISKTKIFPPNALILAHLIKPREELYPYYFNDKDIIDLYSFYNFPIYFKGRLHFFKKIVNSSTVNGIFKGNKLINNDYEKIHFLLQEKKYNEAFKEFKNIIDNNN